METENGEPFRPTHMAFATFWNFIGELASRPLPPQLDRSMMSSKSGTDQSNLMSVLGSFGLVGPAPQHRVEPALVALASADNEQRKAELAKLIRHHYSAAVTLSEQNGTEQQLHQSFKETFGMEAADTRRKAVTFFLHAARTAELPISPHFPATRSGSGGPGASRSKRTTRRKQFNGDNSTASGSGTTATEQRGASGDTYTVQLVSGGQVSVVVDVNLFDLTTDDRNFVIDLVDKLKGYAVVDGQEITKESAS
jgi:hypothetical protein